MSAVRAQRVAAVHGSDDSPAQHRPSRILVIGTSGSGKSTLARRISARLGIPVTATDDLYWRPGWERVPGDEVIDTVLAIAAGDRWVLDGNFDDHRRLLWPLAEHYPIWLAESGVAYVRLRSRGDVERWVGSI